jgi:hypothetical protein
VMGEIKLLICLSYYKFMDSSTVSKRIFGTARLTKIVALCKSLYITRLDY